MSAPDKLRGGSASELTRFKKLWRDTLAEAHKDSLRALFVSDCTQAEVRKTILAKHGINLLYDNQLNAFRDWLTVEDERERWQQRREESEQRRKREHPDWTVDQLREAVLADAYDEASAFGNFKLGLATIKQDVSLQAMQLDRERHELQASEMFLDQTKRAQAERIAASSMSNAEKIAAMRKVLFADVDKFKIQMPEES